MWLIDRADEFIALWQEYVRPTLGVKAARQFIDATRKPRTLFLDKVVWPNLWATPPDRQDSAVYMCVSPVENLPGRHHQYARGIKELGREQFSTSLSELMLFTNAMVAGEMFGLDESGHEIWEPKPKQRVWGALPVTFTVEFDEYDQQFLAEQVAACRSRTSGKPLDTKVGEIFRYFSRFADFLGMSVVWSGHKSLHYHVVFEPLMAIKTFGLNPQTMRSGFIDHWGDVEAEVRRILRVPDHIFGDPALKLPEAFRRLPNGRRIIKPTRNGKPHLLGLPVGTAVPQVVLWEQFRRRRSTDADALFFRPSAFIETAMQRQERMNRGVGVGSSTGPLSEEQRAYCEDQLRQWYASQCEWPRVAHLAFESGRWVAHFHAGPDDRNPSSIMRADCSTILGCGKGADMEAPMLPLPLNAMMRHWLVQIQRQTEPHGEAGNLSDGDPGWIDRVNQRELTVLERNFQKEATSYAVVPDLMRKAIRASVMTAPFTWIKGPEGSQKTRGTMTEHSRLMHSVPAELRLSMYAFNTYDAAERKADEFNGIHQGKGYWAVAVKAWEREYREVCDALGLQPLCHTEAFNAGYDSLWAAIADKQPEAIRALSRRHAEVWQSIGDRWPVLMTQHATMENWTSESRTRLFWHQSYFNHLEALQKGGVAARQIRESMRADMRLGLAVHDEVSAASLLDCRRDIEVEWVQGLQRTEPDWRASEARQADLFTAWQRHAGNNGLPRRGGTELVIDFHSARRIAEVSDWQDVAVGNSGEYQGYEKPEFCIYSSRAGNRWYVRTRTWWSGLAHRVVTLTTETLPTLLASRLPEAAVLGQNIPAKWTVVELETPKLQRDEVKVTFDRSCIASRVPEVIERFRATHGGDFIAISNRASDVTNSLTHAAAKGRNGLETARIVQTMLHMGPDEYELHEVYNAWAGVDICGRLRHVDEFSQTAGRNLGFRRRGDEPEHWLVISQTLWRKIAPLLIRHSRYDLRVCVSNNGVKYIKKKAA